MVLSFSCVFFFFKQKTAYEMRISDWSSDVCSSDLDPLLGASAVGGGPGRRIGEDWSDGRGDGDRGGGKDDAFHGFYSPKANIAGHQRSLDAGGCMNRTLPDVHLRFGRRHPHAQVPGSIGPGFLQLALVLFGRFTGRVVGDRKSTRLNSSHSCAHRMPSSA